MQNQGGILVAQNPAKRAFFSDYSIWNILEYEYSTVSCQVSFCTFENEDEHEVSVPDLRSVLRHR